jgi:hypothetical protein
MTQMERTSLLEDFDHIENLYSGFESLFYGDKNINLNSVIGCEKYFLIVSQLYGYAGTEGAFWDGVKKAATTLYEAIKNTLKKIKDFFFGGEGEAQASKAIEDATESLNSISDLDPNTPIPENSPVLNPDKYFKKGKGEKFEEAFKEDSALKGLYDSVESLVGNVKNCKTVGEFKTWCKSYTDKVINLSKTATLSLKSSLDDASSAAENMKNPKAPAEDAPKEVQEAAKLENKEKVDEAKEETRVSKFCAQIRTSAVASLMAITSTINNVKNIKPESEFKG